MAKGLEARLVSGQNKQFQGLDRECGLKGVYGEYLKAGAEDMVCLILRDGQAVACGVLREVDEERAELTRLYVKPEFRRKGYARQLLDTLETQAMFQGFGAVCVAVEKNQKELQTLLRSMEYQPEKGWKPELSGVSFVVLGKQLF